MVRFKKNILRIFMLFLLFFGIGLSSVSADVSTAGLYYSFDDDDINGTTVLDLSGNNRDGVNNGATTGQTGKLEQAFSYDGTNAYVDANYMPSGLGSWGFNAWVKSDDTPTASEYIFGSTTGSSDADKTNIGIRIESDNTITLINRNSGGGVANILNQGSITSGVWTMITATYDGSTVYLYQDGTLLNSAAQTGTFNLQYDFNIGSRNDAGANRDYFDGLIDEFSFYTSLNTSQINELYNGGNGFNPYQTGSTITFNNPQEGDYLNNTNFTLNVSFSQITNSTYQLNGGNETTLGTNTNESTINLTGIEGLNNITVFTNTSGVLSNSSINFTVDTINPVITVNNFTEYNGGFILPISELNLSCTDSNLDTCIIFWDDGTNSSYLDTNKTFNQSKFYSFNVTATDLANNTATVVNKSLLINPDWNITFKDNINNQTLTNYSVTIFQPNGTQEVKTDTNGTITIRPFKNNISDFGSYNIEFDKLEYELENFTLNITNNESNILTNFTTTKVNLIVKAYASNNPTVQIPFNITILNSTSSQVYTNQNTLTLLYNESLTGDLELIISADGFKSARYFNTLNPQTSIEVDAFLFVNTTAETYTFSVREAGLEKTLEDVLIEAQVLSNGSYTTLTQAQTDSSGQTFMELDPSISYRFIFTKTGYVQTIAESIPGRTDYSVKLTNEGKIFDFVNNINSQFTPSDGLLYTDRNYSFKGFLFGTSITSMTYRILGNGTTEIYSDTSTNPTGTTFLFNLSNTTFSQYTTITQQITYISDGLTNTVSKSYTVKNLDESFIQFFEGYSQEKDEDSNLLRWFIMVLSIGTSYMLDRTLRTGGLMVIVVAAFFTYGNWMPATYFAVISVSALILWLGGRR